MPNVDVHPESAKKPTHIPSPEASFERFYRECRPFVRSIVLQRGVPEREADDLVQEVFVIAWRRWDSLVTPEGARSWISTIAFYVASNHQKLLRYRVEHLADRDPPEPTFEPRVVEAMDAARRVERAVRRLSRKVWVVARAYLTDGRSMPEIARTLRIPLDTAYARLGLARRRLSL
ncbi:RNA polymerase sigma factor [Polyangium jinanense]|uniref:RNA polymerase sigma factor n=1 Tax=Polyangium jinanense TaxID=2829994 RepID=A0A9X3X400_9BACT|nr:sigma-70 family RNA polymerase sigma factor [Polyangium jinanense]MDC3959967.1 sigma-70 family RNA polymerase sigma factor [Polyangium jinanense]MDC3983847.1 sigma-70 family RNA polymerase sigma factor [Polyangium jinanense]